MKSFLVVSALISLTLLLGRLAGFLRETAMANVMGASALTDAAVVMLTLPDFMVGLLLSGGFSAALIPALAAQDGRARIAILRRVAGWSFLAFVLLAVAMAAVPQAVLALLAPSLAGTDMIGLNSAFRLSLISLPLVALIGAAGAYLHTAGRFLVPNFAVLLYNLVLTLFILMWVQTFDGSIIAFAMAIVLATLLRLIANLAWMREVLAIGHAGSNPAQADGSAAWEEDGAPKANMGLLQNFIFGTTGLTLLIGAPIVFRALHSQSGEGQLALFNFAQKLFELPSAILIAPIVAVLLPLLSRLRQRNSALQFETTFHTALVTGFALAMIAAALGIPFLAFFAELVYLHGQMSPQEVEQISILALIFLCSLPFLAVAQICMVRLSAKGETVVMFQITLALLVAAIGVVMAGRWLASGTAVPLAAIGYGLFHALLALALLWHSGQSRAVLPPLGKIIGKTLLAALPFWLLTTYVWTDLSSVAGLALAVPAALLQLWIHRSAIVALQRLRANSE